MREEQELLKNELAHRLDRNSRLFFATPKIVTSVGEFNIIERKNLFGLSNIDGIILEPIFDEVYILNETLFSLGILKRHALYNANQRKYNTEFMYQTICLQNFFLKMDVGDGSVHYWDIENNRMLLRGNFDEISVKNVGEYLWVRKGHVYDFISRESGQLMHIPGMTMAYDTQYGMFGMNEFNKVCCYDTRGVASPHLFRRVVLDAGGYITLKNLSLQIEHIVDINGNILN